MLGHRKIHRLSRRGNRRLNQAIHMAAVTQIRHRHTDGRAYYDRKLAEGRTSREALRSLKRRVSDDIYRQACQSPPTQGAKRWFIPNAPQRFMVRPQLAATLR